MSNFVVSSLKYRPKDFDSVVGQDHVTKTLKNSIIENKIPSALLFCGPRGVGKTSCAIIYAKEINSKILIYGVEPEEADDAFRSLKHGAIQLNKTTNTICDGLRAQLGDLNFSIIKDKVDEIITVSEKEIINAMRMIWERMKIIVEPSCAITLGAILKRKDEINGKKIGLIMSGGNVDLSQLPWREN